MSSPSLAAPRLYRASEHGYLGGVAAGIGEHLNVSVWLIRIAFVMLAFSGGLGLALYGTYWIVLPTRAGKRSARLPSWLEYPAVAIVVAAA
ncbi:MAG TPA: PspC domain-containing protein, partial [Mycobacteriales bacterium]